MSALAEKAIRLMLGETRFHGERAEQSKTHTVHPQKASYPTPGMGETCQTTAFHTPTTKQAVVDLVTANFKDGQYLSDQEFTDRYMVLMRAYRNGIIDEQMRDEGLEFLLDHWDYAKQNRPQ